MNRISCRKTEENGLSYSREFDLPRDFTVEDLMWVVQVAEDHYHHSMRVGYFQKNDPKLYSILNVDAKGNIQVYGMGGTYKPEGLERVLRKTILEGVAAGNRLYIEATGVCEETKEESEELLKAYTQGIPLILDE